MPHTRAVFLFHVRGQQVKRGGGGGGSQIEGCMRWVDQSGAKGMGQACYGYHSPLSPLCYLLTAIRSELQRCLGTVVVPIGALATWVMLTPTAERGPIFDPLRDCSYFSASFLDDRVVQRRSAFFLWCVITPIIMLQNVGAIQTENCDINAEGSEDFFYL